ncbi:MAG: AbgT family transporter [Acidimicrobiales bacterium]|nr:AbgT family transporter [Actinomycetota bacterium]
MSDATAGATDEAVEPKGGGLLNAIERIGDKVPHPAIIFLALCGFVIVLSAVLAAIGVSVTYESVDPAPPPAEVHYEGGTSEPSYTVPAEAPDATEYEVHTETTEVESLLSADGLRFIFTSSISNFNGFGVVGVILVAMVGVGVAEEAGLIAALIRKLVKVAPPASITFIVVFLGMLSSVASDAGYLVLIPLGAATFLTLGRHPLAGLAAAYAGVSAGFGVNVLIAPFDGVLTEITNEAIHLVDPSRSIDITANYFFAAVSTFVLTIAMTVVTTRIVEKRLGSYDHGDLVDDGDEAEPAAEIDPEAEARGLTYAFRGLLVVLAVIVVMTAPSWGPLRDPETGAIIGTSPFMDSLLFLIMLIFLVSGYCYGKGAGTITTSTDAINAIQKTFAGLAGLIFLLLIIAQFIAYFNYSNMATVAAVNMADWLESANIGALWLLVGFIVVTMVLNLIIPGIMPKWAIFAPVFVPLFLRLDVAPQTVLAAYRIGDSPSNVITPLMVYLPFIVVLAQKYKRDAGVGTVVSLMIPYTLVLAVVWILLFVVWYSLGIPFGPGSPVHL